MINLIGQKFNMLTVVSEGDRKKLPSGQKPRVFTCVCDCGNKKDVLMLHLVRNRIKSCGCAMKTRNGESLSKLFKKWKAMHERCLPTARDASVYSNKGISVCSEWSDYFVFRDWALKNGFKEGLTIDRINGEKGYSPDNCRFVSQRENNLNRNVTFYVYYKGEKKPLMIVLIELNILEKYETVKRRIKSGWSLKDAIDKPIRVGNYRKKAKMVVNS